MAEVAAEVVEVVEVAVAVEVGESVMPVSSRRRRSRYVLPLLLASALLFGSLPAVAAGRVALVIGNAHYTALPALINPTDDAKLLAASLQKADYTVTLMLDASLDQLRAGVDSFAKEAAGSDVALVYYSGHGVQADGVNYLVPVSAAVHTRADLPAEALPLEAVVNAITGAAPRLGVVILDACRNNPLPAGSPSLGAARSLVPSEGLARVPTPARQGMLIAYSTAPGQIALDGPPGQNSPFAAALAGYIDEPGLDVGLLFRKVSDRVREVTGGAQVPWIEAALTGQDVFLTAPPATAPADPLHALNDILGISDPTQQRLALARFVTENKDSPFVPVADAYLASLRSADEARAAGVSGGLEAAVADWQEVEAVAGTTAEPLALDAFLALHPSGDLADRARARSASLPADAQPAAGSAAKGLWPLILAAAQPEQMRRFAGLFTGTPEAADAQARIEIAALAPEVATVGSSASSGDMQVVNSVVGTGPTDIRIEGTPTMVAVLSPPRYGQLVTAGEKGLVPSLGEHPVLIQSIAYEPRIDVRDVVDETRLKVGGEGAERDIGVQIHVTVDPCDRLAGARFDTQGVVLGLYPNEVDPAKAVPACRAAVERFPTVARFQYELGRALEVQGNYAEAASLYKKAGDSGHAVAVTALGGLYQRGDGVARDPTEAVALYEQAAAKDDPLAMNNLGRVYRDGDGVPKDRDKAVDWFLKAAAHGQTFAYNNLGYMLAQEGKGDRAIVLFRASAEAGDIYGYNNMGWAYENGVGVTRDMHQAISWYEKAAAAGQPNAPVNLGLIYSQGKGGVAKDPRKAAQWFGMAARNGSPWGNVHLAEVYASGGLGGKTDGLLAAQLLARASTSTDPDAKAAATEDFQHLPQKATVAALQDALNTKGFAVGAVDGVLGQKTRAALESFAAKHEPPIRPGTPLIDVLAALLVPTAG
jgi:TPR repeat protein